MKKTCQTCKISVQKCSGVSIKPQNAFGVCLFTGEVGDLNVPSLTTPIHTHCGISQIFLRSLQLSRVGSKENKHTFVLCSAMHHLHTQKVLSYLVIRSFLSHWTSWLHIHLTRTADAIQAFGCHSNHMSCHSFFNSSVAPTSDNTHTGRIMHCHNILQAHFLFWVLQHKPRFWNLCLCML